MANIQCIEISKDQKDIYNQFVVNSPTGSFLQSWEWGEWQEALGRQVFRYWILDISGETVGIAQFIKMPLVFGKFYLYAPYGPIFSGQWAVDSGQFFRQLSLKFSGAIFIRLELKDASLVTSHYPLVTKSINIQPAKTLIIDLSKTEEQLLGEMRPKTRYNIHLAQKHRVEIQDEFEISIGHGLYAKEAVELIAETSRRQGYKGYNTDYYQRMINYLALQNRGDLKLHIYKAIFQNQLLASAIMIDFSKTRTFLFGGSSEEHKNVMAPFLLHFKAMLDAKATGLTFYDFWGVETSHGNIPGFVRFKLGFGGEVKEYSGAYDVVNKSFLYGIYKVFRYIHRLL